MIDTVGQEVAIGDTVAFARTTHNGVIGGRLGVGVVEEISYRGVDWNGVLIRVDQRTHLVGRTREQGFVKVTPGPASG